MAAVGIVLIAGISLYATLLGRSLACKVDHRDCLFFWLTFPFRFQWRGFRETCREDIKNTTVYQNCGLDAS